MTRVLQLRLWLVPSPKLFSEVQLVGLFTCGCICTGGFTFACEKTEAGSWPCFLSLFCFGFFFSRLFLCSLWAMGCPPVGRRQSIAAAGSSKPGIGPFGDVIEIVLQR